MYSQFQDICTKTLIVKPKINIFEIWKNIINPVCTYFPRVMPLLGDCAWCIYHKTVNLPLQDDLADWESQRQHTIIVETRTNMQFRGFSLNTQAKTAKFTTDIGTNVKLHNPFSDFGNIHFGLHNKRFTTDYIYENWEYNVIY